MWRGASGCFGGNDGGAESDNWAVKAAFEMKREQWRHIVTTRIEHHAVLRACGHLEKGNFRRDVLEAEQPTLLAVMVSDCVWCREPEPVLAELAADGANV